MQKPDLIAKQNAMQYHHDVVSFTIVITWKIIWCRIDQETSKRIISRRTTSSEQTACCWKNRTTFRIFITDKRWYVIVFFSFFVSLKKILEIIASESINTSRTLRNNSKTIEKIEKVVWIFLVILKKTFILIFKIVCCRKRAYSFKSQESFTWSMCFFCWYLNSSINGSVIEKDISKRYKWWWHSFQ